MKIRFVLLIILLIVLCLTGCTAEESWENTVHLTSANITDLTVGTIKAESIKSGVNQTDAEAIAGEFWIDTSDNNTIKVGQ